MPRVALTDRFCAGAKAIGERSDFFDETVTGLAFRVTKDGHRSWCFHFTSPRDGKRARATIGTYPATSLAGARGKALEAKGHVEEGRGPASGSHRSGERLNDRGRADRRLSGRSGKGGTAQ
jgi:Arm DNA-binding domain